MTLLILYNSSPKLKQKVRIILKIVSKVELKNIKKIMTGKIIDMI